jgi:hypothetical protein
VVQTFAYCGAVVARTHGMNAQPSKVA